MKFKVRNTKNFSAGRKFNFTIFLIVEVQSNYNFRICGTANENAIYMTLDKKDTTNAYVNYFKFEVKYNEENLLWIFRSLVSCFFFDKWNINALFH